MGEDHVSWCDKLASTPTVGFRLDPHIASGDSIMDALSPILTKLTDGDKLLFDMQKHDTLGVTFTTHSGFQYGVDQSHIHVAFQHRLRAIHVSGGVPTLELLTTPQPYTKLLPETFDRLIEAALLLPNIRSRALRRVGAVSTTMVAEEDLPPGIRRVLDYLGRPWGQAPEAFTFNGTYVLDEQEDWTDKCVYTISRTEENQGLLQVVFDWGRHFEKTKLATRENLKRICADVEKKALAYLEELAEGTKFDEKLDLASV